MKVKLDVVLKKRPAPPPQQRASAAAAAAATATTGKTQGAVPKLQPLPSIKASLNAAWVTPPASPSISLHRIAPLPPPPDKLPKQQSPPRTLPKPMFSLRQRTQSLWSLPNQNYCPPASPICKKNYELVRMSSLGCSRKSLRPDSQLEAILEPFIAERDQQKAFCSSKASLV